MTDGAFSRDGALLATGGNDQTALVWDARTGERIHRLQAHVGSVHAVDFGSGFQLYTAGDGLDLDEGTEVVFADLDDGRIIRRVHIDSWGLRANFSSNGRLYAYGDSTARSA